MAKQIVQAQWEDTTGLPVGCHHRVRCLHDGLLGRFVRIEDECLTANILQLESRPHGLDSGCLLNLMGRDVPLPFPSLRSYPRLSGQDQQGGGVGSIDCTRLAGAAMVPSTSPEVNETTNPPTSHSGYCLRPRGTSSPPSSEGSSANGRLACLRHSFHTEGLSDRVIEVIRRSWRKSTESAYSGAWKLWDSWCSQRSLDPLSAPVNEILEFRTKLGNSTTPSTLQLSQ